MKCFVIADVHSFYYEMLSALNLAGFEKDNPQHVLISLGDLLDRGEFPKECLEFINSLPRKILIKGNHEELMEEAIKRKMFLSHDFHNCTFDTVKRLVGDKDDDEMLEEFSKNELWNKYINSCIDYAETNKYIFVHGWIPQGLDWRNGDWSSARWTNGMKAWRDMDYDWSDYHLKEEKTILCGHWHTSWGHHYIENKGPEWDAVWFDLSSKLQKADFKPFKKKGIIALDACTAYSKFCNCQVLTIGKEQLEKYL